MFSPLISQLLLMTLVTGVACWLIARRFLSAKGAFLLTSIRLLIPFLYFALGFGGTWQLQDDVQYVYASSSLLDGGWTPIRVLLTPEGRDRIFMLSGGSHIAYVWWNLLAQYLFGEGYAAAVFLNSILLFAAAALFAKLTTHARPDERYARGIFCFLIFHPELLVWSSFMNLKEIVVMTLTVAMCYATVLLCERVCLTYIVTLASCIFVLLFLRFYVPALFSIAAILWLVFFRFRHRLSRVMMIAVPSLAIGAVGYFALPGVRALLMAALEAWNASSDQSYAAALRPSIFGSFQYLLTPRPWSVTPDYSFLTVPAVLHWVWIVPALAMAPRLMRSSKPAALCLIYLVATVLLYGAYPELREPRHRVQVTFVIAWLEFESLVRISHALKARQRTYRTGSTPDSLLPPGNFVPDQPILDLS